MAKTIKFYGHTFEVMNAKTERAQRIYRAFCRSDEATLDDAYGRYSSAKARAYNDCVRLEIACGGWNGCITGHNTCTFSYAFQCLDENGKEWLVYITPTREYAIDYDAL